MMAGDTHFSIALPCEAAPLVWRIIGVDESPLRPPLGDELVEQWVRNGVSCCNQDLTIDEIRSWFHLDTAQWVLRDELRVPVAMLILHGIKGTIAEDGRNLNDDIAFWAVGSIHPDLAEAVIRSQWSADETRTVVEYALEKLVGLCRRNQVINPDRIVRTGGAQAEVTVNTTQQQDMLKTFRNLRDCERWLYPAILNVVSLLIKLNPELLVELVERVDHPVVQRWAAQCAAGYFVPIDLQMPLEWITNNSPDAAVALAIVHTLENVNYLDTEAHRDPSSRTEPGGPDDMGSDLLVGLLDRLGSIEPTASARWIVQLLSYSVAALRTYGSAEKPKRVEELEQLCIQQLMAAVCQHWSSELSRDLRAGLRPDPLVPRTLPIAQLAWGIRESCPARAAEIAQTILDEHEVLIAEALYSDRRLSYLWNNWTDHDSMAGLATALVLFDKETEPLAWVLARCRSLPLSVWDAEDNWERFRKADEAARIYFVAALYAAQILNSLGHTTDSASVRAIGERLWEHYKFVGQHTYNLPGDFVVAEFAARVVVQLGEPSESWLLDQVNNPAMSLHILWALVDETRSKTDQVNEAGALRDNGIWLMLLQAISNRYGSLRGMSLDDLRYLAKLWLLLGGADEAEHTAENILAFGPPQLQRSDQITALDLLAFAAKKGKVTSRIKKRMDSLYSDLWSGGTPRDEIAKRQDVDYLLSQSTEKSG